MSEQQQQKKRVNNKAECDTIKIFYLKINPYVVFSFGGLAVLKALLLNYLCKLQGNPNSCLHPSATFEEMKNKLQRMRVSHVIAGL